MNWQLLLPLLVTSFVAIVGWYFLHSFARKRDIENKQKELRINYLIEVWRKLNYVSSRGKTDQTEKKEITKILEEITTDIQLFGTSKQISLMTNILTVLKDQHKVSLDELLDDLRRSLREELGFEPIDGEVHFFRINK